MARVVPRAGGALDPIQTAPGRDGLAIQRNPSLVPPQPRQAPEHRRLRGDPDPTPSSTPPFNLRPRDQRDNGSRFRRGTSSPGDGLHAAYPRKPVTAGRRPSLPRDVL